MCMYVLIFKINFYLGASQISDLDGQKVLNPRDTCVNHVLVASFSLSPVEANKDENQNERCI